MTKVNFECFFADFFLSLKCRICSGKNPNSKLPGADLGYACIIKS